MSIEAPLSSAYAQLSLRQATSGGHHIPYYCYCPPDCSPRTPVIVCVHGITRNAINLAEGFLTAARESGALLIAPYFSAELFPDYQRLGSKGAGGRADLALRAILADASSASGADTGKFLLFGFSGGAQFAHRYAMLYPHEVERLVISSSGWYTFPDFTQSYPLGLKTGTKLGGQPLLLPELLNIPTLALVGELDTGRDPGLHSSIRVDARQGLTRLERGRRWVRAMRAAAAHYNIHNQHHFELLTGAGHDLQGCMENAGLAARVMQFLMPATLATVAARAAEKRAWSTADKAAQD